MAIELTLLSRVDFAGREITGPRLHGLLALLAADLRTGCGTSRLVEGLWPDEKPENPAKALQILVSRVRAQLGSDVVVRTSVGYRLALGEEQVDTSAVLLGLSASAQQARSGDHAAALAQAEAGLALWAQAQDTDPGLGDPLSVLRTERGATRRALVRARALALSRLNRAGEAFEPLAEVVRERPRDEEALLELLRSEAATGGPAAALARYDAYRRTLREELGTDPGPALRAGYQQLLKGERPAVRHGVAHEPNPLLGRDDDIAAVTQLLETSRVTSIVGPGGLGKTRLAHAVSRNARQRVVHFVPLAGVTDDDGVAFEVASALGSGENPRAQAAATATTAADHRQPAATAIASAIVETLGSGPVLLVLDNCEQVVQGAAELVRTLVSMSKGLRILTTSRTPLGLSSESVYLLPELDLPTTLELFTQRATAARSTVDLPADAVQDLCRHLDGLPLAIELAAARVRVMSVPDIARRLGDRFALLRGGARDAPERHRALHAVVEWSWNLLEPAGQEAMRALSVFPGGFTADAARHLIGDDFILEQLVDQSLLKTMDTPSGTRFRMLETVREFSTAAREASPADADRVMAGFLGWARDFGVAHHESAFGSDPFTTLERIRAEQDNLVQALRHGLDIEDGAVVAATSAVLACFWTLAADYGRMTWLSREISRLLSHFRPEPEFVEPTRTVAAICILNTLAVQGPGAARLQVVLRHLPRAAPDTLIRAMAIVIGADGPAEVLKLCDHDVPLLAGVANSIASYIWEHSGDLLNALAAAERMLEAFGPHSTPWVLVSAHGRIGELCLNLERGEQARRHLRAALEALGPWPDMIDISWALVTANLQLGDIDEAEHWLEHADLKQADDTFGQINSRLGLRAEILLARGQTEAGLRMWRRAADPAMGTQDPLFQSDPPGLEPWTLETQAAVVVAHAQHGRLDLVEETIADIPPKLTAVLANPTVGGPAYQVDFPVCGALLLALAMVRIARGDASGAIVIALAERFGYLKGFQPTMSSARVREAAESADKAGYDDAVSSYAGLDHDALRAVALAATGSV
jgi:predicted ATPase/DNA-binding SARP family transcriptional activator/tetratricopeptide (TPR) repeat protein